MSEKIVLIGAGSANFGLEAVSDIFKSKSLIGSEIVLHDTNIKALKETQDVAEKFKSEWGVNFTVTSKENREEALKNATFVVISIEVSPRFELWDEDWKFPQQFGIKQIYAENGGPGGLFHSLRIIPPILKICEDINKICPEATVFNFSNPMQRICHAVNVKFPKMKFIGLCHAIAEMERDLPELLQTDFSNIEYRAGGLNHISILTEVRFKDTQKDAYPIIREKALEYYKNYVIDFEKMNEQLTSPGAERGIFLKLLETYNYLPITTDSHLGEYLPWAHSIADHKAILHFYKSYKENCMTVYRSKEMHSFYFDRERKSKERLVELMEAIVEDKQMEEAAVNILNNNFIKQIPNDIVVEVPAIVGKDGIKGIKLDNYPDNFASILVNQVGTIRLTTQAVLEESKEVAFQALLSDPVVDNYNSAKDLLDTMIYFQKDHLGYLK
ncbi:MAG: glycosyl hydrolase family 4 [Proteobacteria bacterium]|nr:glycosyl hydrolase family 4 [Pseudomonadota bacterium]